MRRWCRAGHGRGTQAWPFSAGRRARATRRGHTETVCCTSSRDPCRCLACRSRRRPPAPRRRGWCRMAPCARSSQARCRRRRTRLRTSPAGRSRCYPHYPWPCCRLGRGPGLPHSRTGPDEERLVALGRGEGLPGRGEGGGDGLGRIGHRHDPQLDLATPELPVTVASIAGPKTSVSGQAISSL